MFPDNIDVISYIPNLDDAKQVNQSLENDFVDNTLKKLFTELCPDNTCKEDILIKCTTLNKLYSTNIINLLPIAEHIHHLDIDDRLMRGDTTLIDQIANVEIKGKHYRFYSFATKYCAFHKPELFNIYDSNVHKVLKYFLNIKYADTSLKCYDTYRQALKQFQEIYHLTTLTPWQLDKYLWLLGKFI